MRYALVENGVVTQVTSQNPYYIFDPSMAAQFIECPEEVMGGWTYDGTTWSDAPPPFGESDMRALYYQRIGQRELALRENFYAAILASSPTTPTDAASFIALMNNAEWPDGL